MTILALKQNLETIRSNKTFEFIVIAVIILSALLIGVKTYQLNSTFINILILMDIAVTVFFLIELTIRLVSEEKLLNFFKKGWNIFDFVIVAISLIPLEETEMALLARLLRVFRVLRLISIIPELRVLMSSFLKSIPRMAYVCLLMFIIFYIYAAVGSVLFAEINPVLWGNISISLLTLFRISTFEDWTDVMYETMDVYPLSWIFYLSFIFLSVFVFLNMMIGIILEVMQSEHKLEEGNNSKEDQILASLALLHQRLDKLK